MHRGDGCTDALDHVEWDRLGPAEGQRVLVPIRGDRCFQRSSQATVDFGLSQAGFVIEAERSIAIELTPPLPAATSCYAQLSLRRMRANLEDKLSVGDLATLDTLLDSEGPVGIRQRDDLSVRAERTVLVARRP